jgi:hypothetical protein
VSDNFDQEASGRQALNLPGSAIGDGVGERGWVVGSPFTCSLDRGKLANFERRSRLNRQNGALIQCRVSGGGSQ